MTLAKLLVAIGASTRGFQRGLAGAGNSVDALERKTGRMRRGFGSAGGALGRLGKIAAGVAVGGILALSLGIGVVAEKAIAWEDAFAGVAKTVDATDAELATLGRGIRDLSLTIPVSANELASLAEQAGALGIAKKDILEFTRVSALIGVTTNVSSIEAATALGQLSNVLGLTGKDYERFASTLVDLGNKGASTEAQILTIAARSGAGANLIGFAAQQTLAWGSAVASLGIEVEAGGTALQTFYLRSLQVVASGGQMDKVAKGAGISVDKMLAIIKKGGKPLTELGKKLHIDPKLLKGFLTAGAGLNLMAKTAGMTGKAFKKLFEKDASGGLQKFLQGLGKMKAGDQIAVLKDLGLTDSRVIRTILGLANAQDLLTNNLNTANSAWEANLAMQVEADKRTATTKSQLALLGNILTDVAVTLGTALLPIIISLIKPLGEWIKANQALIAQLASQLAVGIQTVIGFIGQAIGAIAGWISANGPLINQIGTVLVGAISSAWTWITTKLIPAFVSIVTWVRDNVVPKIQAFIATMTGPGGVVDSVGKVVAPILDQLIPAFGSVVSALFGGGATRGLIPAFGDLVAAVWGDGKGPLAKAVSALGMALSLALGVLGVIIEKVAQAIDLARTLGSLLPNPHIGEGPNQILVDQIQASHDKLLKGPNLKNLVPPPRAAGGPVMANRPYLVGERGPELVVPRAAATVISHDELGRGGRGGDTHITINNPEPRAAERDVSRVMRRLGGLGLVAASPR